MTKCALKNCKNIICYRLKIKICESHKCDIYNCPNIAVRDIEMYSQSILKITQVCCRKICFDQITMQYHTKK